MSASHDTSPLWRQWHNLYIITNMLAVSCMMFMPCEIVKQFVMRYSICCMVIAATVS
jgi:hypothetical protein